ncbi:MAG: penicillin acylase family protein [Chloroflexi bacterium]|nr:MAG: penicillin acylase family protein [Chloroflexota bacterium]
MPPVIAGDAGAPRDRRGAEGHRRSSKGPGARRRRRRRTTEFALMACLLALAVPLATQRAGVAATSPPPRAITILPPGEGNTITVPEFLANQASGSCSDLGPHMCDQLDMYKNWQFKDGALSPDAEHVVGAVGSETPAAGVRIVRDNFGIPHIFASGANEQAIEDNVAFGVGYAQAEERLFQMEVLRRAAEGTISELVGPGTDSSYATMDFVTRRDSETSDERIAEIRSILTAGQQASLQRYADGINAYINVLTLHPDQMPAGFVLTSDLPVPEWSPTDALAIQILEAKQVGESAGNELGYGGLARRLKNQYGVDPAVGILNDLQFTEDPLTPTSVPHRQAASVSTDALTYDFISYTRADTAARIGELPASIDAARQAVASGADAIHATTRALGLPQFGSNAWAVSPSKSSTGGALLWGAPQVSYYVPQVVDELEISGGLTHVRGMSVPGAGPAVVIGYTPRLSWSITTAQDDQVDTYIDRIRSTDGGRTYQYFWRGGWRAVEQRTETIRTRTSASGPLPAPPLVYTSRTATFYRTLHGPLGGELPCTIDYIDTSAGVSYCKARAFWGSELLTGVAIVGLAQATNLSGADAALRKGVVGFNFIYADADGHIAYWHTGRIPLRVHGHDTRLPAPGDGSFDWKGYLDPQLWPHVMDPTQGFIASWNNKPQLSWPDSGDGSLWGAQQRAGQPVSLLRAGRALDQTPLWQVARRTGELDLRDTLGFRGFLTGLAGRPDLSSVERAAVAQVAGWDGTAFYPDGAERDASGKETGKVKYAGFAVLSAWFQALETLAAQAVFQPVTGNSNAKDGVLAFTQHAAGSSEFEFFDDYDAFLFNVMAGRTRSGADYLGGRSVSDLSKAALDAAVSPLSHAQGTTPAAWRADMPQIVFFALDVANIPNIPWENRGTWGQAVDYGTGVAAAPDGVAASALPNTAPRGVAGPGFGVLAVFVCLMLIRVLGRRRIRY